jgi:hypothetical protein
MSDKGFICRPSELGGYPVLQVRGNGEEVFNLDATSYFTYNTSIPEEVERECFLRFKPGTNLSFGRSVFQSHTTVFSSGKIGFRKITPKPILPRPESFQYQLGKEFDFCAIA